MRKKEREEEKEEERGKERDKKSAECKKFYFFGRVGRIGEFAHVADLLYDP